MFIVMSSKRIECGGPPAAADRAPIVVVCADTDDDVEQCAPDAGLPSG
jgi:hypothetical protein